MDMVPSLEVTSAALADRTLALDPYSTYHALREKSPIQFTILPGEVSAGLNAPLQAWAFLRYQDVLDAFRDHETFSNQHQLIGELGPRLALFNDDPPRHKHLRRLVNKTFAPMRIAAIQPWISEVANRTLDTMGSGSVDFMAAYAIPLPIQIIARFLGIPGEMYPTLKYWTDGLISAITMVPEQRKAAIAEMQGFFGKLATERRSNPKEDLITLLVQAEPSGEALEDAEIISFCMSLLVAGNDTTTNLLGNMLGTLAKRPDLWQKLREDRSLLNTCIEETFRHESPVQRLYRRTKKDVEISGVLIPKDSLVLLFCGAANRDPLVFAAPDEFRLDRTSQDHLALGAGIHTCIGAPLARVESHVALTTLLDRFPTIAPGPEPAVRQKRSRTMLGYQNLPLVLG